MGHSTDEYQRWIRERWSMFYRGVVQILSPASFPARDAARSYCVALLRRTWIVPRMGVRYGPGSAAHRSAKGYALRVRPGNETQKFNLHAFVIKVLLAFFPIRLILLDVLSNEGALLEAILKWDRARAGRKG